MPLRQSRIHQLPKPSTIHTINTKQKKASQTKENQTTTHRSTPANTPTAALAIHHTPSRSDTPQADRIIIKQRHRHQERRIMPMRPLDIAFIQLPGLGELGVCLLAFFELLAPGLLGCLAFEFEVEGEDGVVLAWVGGGEEVVAVGGDELGGGAGGGFGEAVHFLGECFAGDGAAAVGVSDVVSGLD
jgi:hypothetical protein